MINSILFIIGVSYGASFLSFLGIVKWIEYAENKEKMLNDS